MPYGERVLAAVGDEILIGQLGSLPVGGCAIDCFFADGQREIDPSALDAWMPVPEFGGCER
jgi:hypothetical protein